LTPTGYSRGGNSEEREVAEEFSYGADNRMANPIPLVRFTRTLQRISNEFGAVYAVSAPDLTQQFEVILGEVA
jgi:hypothetical protein